MEEMKNLLEERFHFISEVNKEFLLMRKWKNWDMGFMRRKMLIPGL